MEKGRRGCNIRHGHNEIEKSEPTSNVHPPHQEIRETFGKLCRLFQRYVSRELSRDGIYNGPGRKLRVTMNFTAAIVTRPEMQLCSGERTRCGRSATIASVTGAREYGVQFRYDVLLLFIGSLHFAFTLSARCDIVCGGLRKCVLMYEGGLRKFGVVTLLGENSEISICIFLCVVRAFCVDLCRGVT